LQQQFVNDGAIPTKILFFFNEYFFYLLSSQLSQFFMNYKQSLVGLTLAADPSKHFFANKEFIRFLLLS